MRGSPFKYFAYGVCAAEIEVDGFTGAYRTRRVDIVHDVGDSLSPLVDLGQVEGGFVQGAGWLTLEDLRWDTSDGRTAGGVDPVRQHLQAAQPLGDARRTSGSPSSTTPTRTARSTGPRPSASRPLMLALAVRESLRQAAAAFGPPGRQRRARLAGHARGRLVGARAGPRECVAGRPAMPDLHWLDAVIRLRPSAGPGVLVTVADVRGHAPRAAGTKMVVAPDGSLGQHRGRQPGGDRDRVGPRRCSRPGRGQPETMIVLAQRQGAHRPRPPVLRGRGHGAARAAGRRAGGRDLRARARGARAGPDPEPSRSSSSTSPTRVRRTSTRARWPSSTAGPRSSTPTTPRSPRWCSARCRAGRTCW